MDLQMRLSTPNQLVPHKIDVLKKNSYEVNVKRNHLFLVIINDCFFKDLLFFIGNPDTQRKK